MTHYLQHELPSANEEADVCSTGNTDATTTAMIAPSPPDQGLAIDLGRRPSLRGLQTFSPSSSPAKPVSLSPRRRNVRESVASGRGERRDSSADSRTQPHWALLRGHACGQRRASQQPLTLKAVTYASKTCGKLFEWCLQQLKLADILHEHGPVLQLASELDARLEARQRSAQHLQQEHAAKMQGCESVELELADLAAVLEGWRRQQAGLLEEQAARDREERQRGAAEGLTRNKDDERQSVEEQEEVARKLENEQCTKKVAKAAPRSEGRLQRHAEELVEWMPVQVEIRRRIEFAKDSAQIAAIALPSVDAVLKVLKANPAAKVCIEGHADADEADADRVSLARAEAVESMLKGKGVPASQLRVAGLGSAPVSSPQGPSTGVAKAQVGGAQQTSNRQVGFQVIQEVVIKGSIEFSPCSSDLDPSCHPLLRDVQQVLQARSHVCLRVEGHTDNSPMWGGGNGPLSEERAASVARFLAQGDSGLAGRLLPIGYGEVFTPFCMPSSCPPPPPPVEDRAVVPAHVLLSSGGRGVFCWPWLPQTDPVLGCN